MEERTYPEDVSNEKVKLDGLHVDACQRQYIHRGGILGTDSA